MEFYHGYSWVMIGFRGGQVQMLHGVCEMVFGFRRRFARCANRRSTSAALKDSFNANGGPHETISRPISDNSCTIRAVALLSIERLKRSRPATWR